MSASELQSAMSDTLLQMVLQQKMSEPESSVSFLLSKKWLSKQ
jgi:hypothetical protein